MSNEVRSLNEVQSKDERNVDNNTKAVRAAADAAAQTNNPYAKAIGTGVQVADKISGGKSSEKLGKTLNTMNKMAGLKGRMLQSTLNKMGESGTTERIGKAVSAKNSNSPVNSPKMNGLGGTTSNTAINTVKNKSESESEDSGIATFAGDFKIVKYGLIGLAAILPIIFCCLFISSSQIFLNTVSLGTADSLSGDEVDKKINKKMKESPEDFDNEINDEETAFNYDMYILDHKSQIFKNNKLYDSKIVQVADIFTVFKRKYNEATLDRIEEFFPAVVDESKNYDENMVYDFYYKMYNLYVAYKSEYRVRLDLPLLMATLNLQSQDKNVIFSSNMDSRYRTNSVKDIPKNELDYYYDWSNYKISRNSSEHDMEILAQHMVSKQVREMCKDSSGKVIKEKILRDDEIGTQTLFCAEGESYETEEKGYVKDEEKYREFLKQFLEKKYYLEGEHSISNTPIINNTINNSNSFADAMVETANREYLLNNGQKGGLKYINAYGGFGPGTPWCAIFSWYVIANTEVNGKKIYPDIIPFKSAGTGTYINLFNSSDSQNINFYYNDSCKNLSGKNGSVKYIPKKGDFIFFDWDAKYTDISSNTQDHTAIVEKYEDGIIYTLEGNISNTISKRKYYLTDCRVIGFGSWY